MVFLTFFINMKKVPFFICNKMEVYNENISNYKDSET